MEVHSQERVKTHRPSQVQVIFHRIRHAGPLWPLMSAYTKDRGELLTGGGEAGLARLLGCRRWQLNVKADLLPVTFHILTCHSSAQQ